MSNNEPNEASQDGGCPRVQLQLLASSCGSGRQYGGALLESRRRRGGPNEKQPRVRGRVKYYDQRWLASHTQPTTATTATKQKQKQKYNKKREKSEKNMNFTISSHAKSETNQNAVRIGRESRMCFVRGCDDGGHGGLTPALPP